MSTPSNKDNQSIDKSKVDVYRSEDGLLKLLSKSQKDKLFAAKGHWNKDKNGQLTQLYKGNVSLIYPLSYTLYSSASGYISMCHETCNLYIKVFSYHFKVKQY